MQAMATAATAVEAGKTLAKSANDAIRDTADMVKKTSNLFGRESTSTSSLSNFTKGEGYESLELKSCAICMEGPYEMCRETVIDYLGTLQNSDVRNQLSAIIPSQEELRAKFTDVSYQDASGRIRFRAAINPQFAIFNTKDGGTNFYAMMAVDFLGSNSGNHVKVVLLVSELKYKLADNWHIQTVTSNKKSLTRSSSSSHQHIVYTKAALSAIDIENHHKMVSMGIGHVADVMALNRETKVLLATGDDSQLLTGDAQSSPPPSLVESSRRDCRLSEATLSEDAHYPPGYTGMRQQSSRAQVWVRRNESASDNTAALGTTTSDRNMPEPPQQRIASHTVAAAAPAPKPLISCSIGDVIRILGEELNLGDHSDVCRERGIDGARLSFVDSVDDLTEEGLQLTRTQARQLLHFIGVFKQNGVSYDWLL
jgi:hypothetical protein